MICAQRLAAGGPLGAGYLVEGHPQPERLGHVLPGSLERGPEPHGAAAPYCAGRPVASSRSLARRSSSSSMSRALAWAVSSSVGGPDGCGRGAPGAAARRRRRTTIQIERAGDHQRRRSTRTQIRPDPPSCAGRPPRVPVRGRDHRTGPVVAAQGRLDVVRRHVGQLAVGDPGVVRERVGVRAVRGRHGEQGVAVAQVAQSWPSRRSTAAPGCRRTTRRRPRTTGCRCRPAAGPAPGRPRPGRCSARPPRRLPGLASRGRRVGPGGRRGEQHGHGDGDQSEQGPAGGRQSPAHRRCAGQAVRARIPGREVRRWGGHVVGGRCCAMSQRVKGVIARAKGAPVEVTTIVVPDPGPGEAVVQDPGVRGVPHRPALPRGRHQRRLPVPARPRGRRRSWSRSARASPTSHPATSWC